MKSIIFKFCLLFSVINKVLLSNSGKNFEELIQELSLFNKIKKVENNINENNILKTKNKMEEKNISTNNLKEKSFELNDFIFNLDMVSYYIKEFKDKSRSKIMNNLVFVIHNSKNFIEP